MPDEPVRATECQLATCRDSRRRRHQTRDEVVLSAPAAAAWRRGWLSDVPTGTAPCSCQVLFPAGPPRTRGFQTACPPDRFGSSRLSARELRKRGRFPCRHLLSTTNECRATAEYSRRYPRRTSCTDQPTRSRYAALPVRCPASGRGETEAAAQCRIRRSPRRRAKRIDGRQHDARQAQIGTRWG